LQDAKQKLNFSEEAAARARLEQGDFFYYNPADGPFDFGYDYT
jgi:hypothetical protein